jgi:hypothetical protein
MIDSDKIRSECTELKRFFAARNLTTLQARETIFRILEYIDNYCGDEDKPFMNGNGNGNGKNGKNYKHKGLTLHVQKEMNNEISPRAR